MGRVRGAVNARALSLARKAVDLCNCWRREAAAERLVEKQVELGFACRRSFVVYLGCSGLAICVHATLPKIDA